MDSRVLMFALQGCAVIGLGCFWLFVGLWYGAVSSTVAGLVGMAWSQWDWHKNHRDSA